jgi:hypothetical protein
MRMLTQPLPIVPFHKPHAEASRDAILFYGDAARNMMHRGKLTFAASLELFNDISSLESFADEVKKMRMLGIRPSEKTMRNYQYRRQDLKVKFKKHGLELSDFMYGSIPHPANIQLTFIGD